MLIIYRHPDQCLQIGADIFLKVLEVVPENEGTPAHVRIGVEAPDETRIIRVESDSAEDRAEANNAIDET